MTTVEKGQHIKKNCICSFIGKFAQTQQDKINEKIYNLGAVHGKHIQAFKGSEYLPYNKFLSL